MPSYQLELSSAAERDLKALHGGVQKEIVMGHLPAIKGNPFRKGKPLSGTLRNERSIILAEDLNTGSSTTLMAT